MDLRPFGLKKVPPWSVFVGVGPWVGGFESLAFAGEDVLLAAFVTPDGEAPFSPLQVHVVLLDAAKGTPLGTREWSVLRAQQGLFATHEGKFCVRTEDRPPGQELRPDRKIVLYSAKLEPLREFALPLARSGLIERRSGMFERWRVYITSTRRSIVVEHRLDRRIEVQWLDPDTLEPKAAWAWTAPKTPFVLDTGLDISDDWIVATFRARPGLLSGRKGSCEVAVRRTDTPWRPLFRSANFGCLSAQFVSDDRVFFAEERETYLFDVDGRVLLHERLGKGEFPLQVRASANGQRFAFAVVTTKGGSWLLDISAHEVLKRIMVYDIPTRRCVYALDARKVALEHAFGFALSPNGLLLGLVRDGFVEVYRLPGYQSQGLPGSAKPCPATGS